MKSFINRIARHSLLVLVAGAALMFASHGARASCSGGGGTFNVPLKTAVVVGRDVAVGALITPWAYSGASVWSCAENVNRFYGSWAVPSGSRTQTGIYAYSSPGSGTSSYKVVDTNIPGVGMVIASYAYTNSNEGCYPGDYDYQDLFAPNRPQGSGSGCGPGSYVWGTQSHEIAVALVKTGAITAGSIPAQEVAQAKAYVGNYPSMTSFVQQGGTAYFRIPAVSVTPASCEVADVEVPLGSRSPSLFTGIGTKVGVTDFVVNVQNCPAGMTAVRYRLELAAGVPAFNATSGIVKLDATSTATGVAVQVMNRSNVAYNFSTMPWTNVTPNYAPATGGNYTIPLRAAYYQTAATVTPGTADSAIMFTMQYL